VTGVTRIPKFHLIFDVLATEITTRAIIRDENKEINQFTTMLFFKYANYNFGVSIRVYSRAD